MTEPTAAERAKECWHKMNMEMGKDAWSDDFMRSAILAALEAHAAAAVQKERERIATKMESGAQHADDLPSLTLMSWAASIRKGATP